MPTNNFKIIYWIWIPTLFSLHYHLFLKINLAPNKIIPLQYTNIKILSNLPSLPINIHCNNQGIIVLDKNPVFHAPQSNVVHHHFFLKLYIYIYIEEQPANILSRLSLVLNLASLSDALAQILNLFNRGLCEVRGYAPGDVDDGVVVHKVDLQLDGVGE